MGLIPENPLVGSTVLERNSIQSPNYTAGSSGWTINQDGSVEFNNGTFRGVVSAGTVELFDGNGNQRIYIGGSGANPYIQLQNAYGAVIGLLSTRQDALLWYQDMGSATQGPLLAAIAGKTGTDSYGTTYPQGAKIFQGQFEGSNYEINSNGLFFYSGTPATGNLVASKSNAGGTDPYNNQYLAGSVTYQLVSGTYYVVQMWQNQVAFWSSTPNMGPYSLNAQVLRRLIGTSPVLELNVTNGPSIDLNANTNTITLTAGSGVVAANPVFATDPINGGAEPWHNLPAPASGWTASGLARYRKLADSNMVRLFIQNLVPPSTKPSDGAAVWATMTLPSQYTPLQNQRFVCYSSNEGAESAALEVRSDGSILVYGIGSTSTNRLDLHCDYVLD